MINSNDPHSFPDSPAKGAPFQPSLRKKTPTPTIGKAPKATHSHFPQASEAQKNVSYIFDARRDVGNALPYYEQFDPDMNTPEKMLERNALKFHPDVREAIRKVCDKEIQCTDT